MLSVPRRWAYQFFTQSLTDLAPPINDAWILCQTQVCLHLRRMLKVKPQARISYGFTASSQLRPYTAHEALYCSRSRFTGCLLKYRATYNRPVVRLVGRTPQRQSSSMALTRSTDPLVWIDCEVSWICLGTTLLAILDKTRTYKSVDRCGS